MNKTEMAEKLAKKCDLSQAKALEIVSSIFDTKPGTGIIAVELDGGGKVQIPGFRDLRHQEPRGTAGTQPSHRTDHYHRCQELSVLQAWQGSEGPGRRLRSL